MVIALDLLEKAALFEGKLSKDASSDEDSAQRVNPSNKHTVHEH